MSARPIRGLVAISAFAGLVALGPAASAVLVTKVLDFNAAAAGNFTSLTEDGFSVTHIGFGNSQAVRDLGGGNKALVDGVPGDASGAAASITLTSLTGVLFNLVSMDVGDLTNNASFASGTCVAGSGSRVQVNSTALCPTSSTFSTPGLGFTGLSSFTLNIVGPYNASIDDFAVDNIVLTYEAVPEPASLALVARGIAGLGPGPGRRIARRGAAIRASS